MAVAARHHLLLRLVATILLSGKLALLAAGDPLGQFCVTSSNYSAKDTYQTNIQSIAARLPKNASSSPALFATASLGYVPDMVFALALCRGDANASACEACVAGAFQDAQELCAYNKDVTILYDPCLVRYSNQNFLTSLRGDFFILIPTNNATVSSKKYFIVIDVVPSSGESVLVLMNTQNVSSPFKVFDAAAGALINATADYAANNSSTRFGTAVKAFQAFDKKNPNIYGLAQCAPSMSSTDCRSCLRDIIAMMPKYFSGKQGGRVLRLWCSFRYEQYPFFLGSPLVQLPTPPMAPEAPAPALPAMIVTPLSPGGGTMRNRTHPVSTIILPIFIVVVAIGVFCCFHWTRKRKPAGNLSKLYSTNSEDIRSINSLIIDLPSLRATTDNFDEGKKLGEGGFGAVYKGILPDGQEIAVKRLSQSSRQGINELKAELVLVAKLQHKNLIRLIGVCLEEHEKLLVYEYMPNKSLDTFLFDADKRNQLEWTKRYIIVHGIAHGLQYLHEESQLKIVHRDLKASNVLLDSNFNPKISDFGLARLFGSDQSKHITKRVVGT